jgi:putative membrane protein insertion efficiency factor
VDGRPTVSTEDHTSPASVLLQGAITVYQRAVSPLLGPSCRFEPSCSEYAREAIRRHGAARGLLLSLRRLLRCHPWGPSGYDPVPGSDNRQMTNEERQTQDRWSGASGGLLLGRLRRSQDQMEAQQPGHPISDAGYLRRVGPLTPPQSQASAATTPGRAILRAGS